jgi:HAD superfamily hydrolase (TIGR01450 family)
MSIVNGAGKILPEKDTDISGVLSRIRVFALDMDGTVYLGEKWIDGAQDFLRRIEESGRRFFFLTNNSSRTPRTYVEKLARMGFAASEDRIITSGQAAIWYLQNHFAGKKVFLLGNRLLCDEFEEAGIALDEEQPDLVVTAFDNTLTYAKLCRVCDLVRSGLPYIATHPDFNCPTETGFVPDIGSIQAFIRASAFRDPDRIIGKPNRDISDYLMTVIGETDRKAVAMVGDRLYTDIAAGINGEMTSILVLSGEASLQDAEASVFTPDLIYRSVKQIPL